MELIEYNDDLLLVDYVRRILKLFNVPLDKVIFVLDDDAYGRPFQVRKDSPSSSYSFCINTNLLNRYKNYLKIFLSYPDLFPGIGSANKELLVSSAHFADNNTLEDELQKLEPFYFDEDRGELYGFLSALLSKLMVVHECFHIINGHTDYISDFKKNHFEENGNYDIDLSLINWQTLELDADACCVCQIMHELQRLRELQIHKPILSTDYQFIYSIQLIFLIILNCEAVGNLSRYKEKRHPIESARLNLISATLHNLGYQQDVFNSLQEILTASSAIIMKAFGYVQGNLFLGMIKEIMEYNGKIINNWKNVRPLLIPYAYADLPE